MRFRQTGGYFIASDPERPVILEGVVDEYDRGASGQPADPERARVDLRERGVTAVLVVPRADADPGSSAPGRPPSHAIPGRRTAAYGCTGSDEDAPAPGAAGPSHGPPSGSGRGGWTRIDLVIVVVLGIVAAAWFLSLAAAASAQGVLTGEETSITQRDGLALAIGWQPSVWSTNAGAQLYYWIAANLDPDFGLLYARKWKAVGTALLAPLLYVAARRRLGCGRVAGVGAAGLVVLLPGVAVMAWLAIETPLDTVLGVAALLVVTSARRWWPVGLVIVGAAVSFYTAALAWAVVVAAVALWRIDGVRVGAGVVLAALGGLAVVLAPLAWWDNGGIVVTGGGREGSDPAAIPGHLVELGHYLARSGSSYYYFADLPMLAGLLPALVLVLAAAVALVRRARAAWPWAAVAVVAVGLYAVSSGVPGSRRLVAVVVVLALLGAAGAEIVVHAVRGPAGRSRGRLVAAMAAALVLALVVVLPAATGLRSWRADMRAGTPSLPLDWPFPVDPGGTETTTLARLDGELRARSVSPSRRSATAGAGHAPSRRSTCSPSGPVARPPSHRTRSWRTTGRSRSASSSTAPRAAGRPAERRFQRPSVLRP